MPLILKHRPFFLVLIVAKCNVNLLRSHLKEYFQAVLIVAKCNVNSTVASGDADNFRVLIVAKCNVNSTKWNRQFP